VWDETLAQALVLGFCPVSLQKHSCKEEFRWLKKYLAQQRYGSFRDSILGVGFDCGVLLAARIASLPLMEMFLLQRGIPQQRKGKSIPFRKEYVLVQVLSKPCFHTPGMDIELQSQVPFLKSSEFSQASIPLGFRVDQSHLRRL
jgi:hypothetical protein